jgi:hypothetical protein
MIANRNDVQPGARLTASYRGRTWLAEVAEGGILITDNMHPDLDGQIFKSLSTAANAITGNSVNGWRFWSLAEPGAGNQRDREGHERTAEDTGADDDEWSAGTPDPTDEEEEAWQIGPNDAPGLEDQVEFDGRPAPHQGQPAPRLQRNIKRTANQRGIPASQVRFFCSACMKSFLSPEDGQGPEACPEGHPVMMPS